MTAVTCAEVRDAAPELVLGTLDGAERARLLDHVGGCPQCREEVAALAGAVNDIALLAPDLPPSAGFVERVLAAGAPLGEPRPVRGASPRRRRRWAVAVGAVALAAALLIAVVGLAGRHDRVGSGSVAFAAMVGPDGTTMGSVSARGDGTVAVDVAYPTNWPDYRLQAVHEDGSASELGTMTLVGGSWRWQGEVPDRDTVARLRVVRPDGQVTCWGYLPG